MVIDPSTSPPNARTWKFKTLSGQTPSVLSGTERTALRDKSSNYYNAVGGVNIVEEGWMSDGSFIDEIRGIDWIHARMQEAIFARQEAEKQAFGVFANLNC